MTALPDLQNALAEFYAQQSSAERLAQLQQSLISFEQRPDSWVSALQFLSLSTDKYVCMFSLTILGSTVQHHWSRLTEAQRQEISRFLEKYIFSPSPTPDPNSDPDQATFMAKFKAKAIVIWTSICKKNFAQTCRGFTEKMASLLHIPSSLSTEAGLSSLALSFTLFKAAYEELVRKDFDTTYSVAVENTFLFNQTVPQILSSLFGVIERLLGAEVTNAVRSMFSHPGGCMSEADFFTSLHYILYLDATLIFSSTPSTQNQLLVKNFVSFLECLNVFLTVASVQQIDNCRMYSLIYIFLLMGSPKILSDLVDASRSRNLAAVIPVNALAELGIQSLSCLAEVVERKDIPRDAMGQLLPFIFRGLYWDLLILDTSFPLANFSNAVFTAAVESEVNLATSNSTNNLAGLASVSQALDSLSEDFYQKMADVLRPLVTVFMLFTKSAENNHNHTINSSTSDNSSLYTFTPAKFLQCVHYFTFNVARYTVSVYLSSLELWNAYLDFVKSFYYGDGEDGVKKQVHLPSDTQEIISQLCASVLTTIYFSDSATFLDLLDTDCSTTQILEASENSSSSSTSYMAFFDDIIQQVDCSDQMGEEESEYAAFMRCSLTLLSSIAFFNPTTVMHSVAAKFQENMNVFTQFCSAPSSVRLVEHTTRKLHSTLRDLATGLNALTYLSNHFADLTDASMLTWLIQALVFNLQAGVTFCTQGLPSLSVETLKLDVVQVMVENIGLIRCLLTSGLLVVSEAENNTVVPQGHVKLAVVDKDAFSTALIKCIHQLILQSPITSLRLHAALLFQTLIGAASPPGFLPPPGLLAEGGEVADLITITCDPPRLKPYPIGVQRLLMRAVTAYLLVDESASPSLAKANPKRAQELQAVMAQKANLIVIRLIPMFNQALQADTLTRDKDAYFAGLCWLNEALAALIPLGSKSRRLMFDSLESCGILSRIWHCLETTSLSVEVHLFIAHLSFFVQFTDIYGNQRATAAMIPGFVATVMQLLQVLERNTATARLVSPVISHLVHLLSSLVQNRTVFPPLTADVLRFVCNCLIINLAGGVTADLPSTVAAASRNDPDLCLRVFRVLFSIMSYGYDQIFTHEELLATFLRPVVAVYDGKVMDARLLIVCTEGLLDLQTRHGFFTSARFKSQWQCELDRRWLCLLVEGSGTVSRGSDAETVLVRALHEVYQSDEGGFAARDFYEHVVAPFLGQIGSPSTSLAAAASIFTPIPNGRTNSLEEFKMMLGTFVTEVRLWMRANGAGDFGKRI